MNKNILTYLAIIIVLAVISLWLFTNRDPATTLNDMSDEYAFYIEDTAVVDRIVMYDKTPSRVELVRTPEGWMVDGEYPARKEAIKTLLTTLNRMQMRNFIPEKMQPTVMRRMEVYGTTVEVYARGKLIHHLVVGTDTQDEMGTYMKLKEADAPYAVHIPGFNGFLSVRFFSEPYLWYKRIITEFHPRELHFVRMIYTDSLDASFELSVTEGGEAQLVSLSTGTLVEAQAQKLQAFIQAASKMRYEGAIIPTDPIYERQDSLLASEPVFNLTVATHAGDTTNLLAYRIKGSEESFDPDLTPPEYDPDRLHAFINKERMVLVQYYGLKKVLKSVRYFENP